MESPSPSKPPARELQIARVSNSPPQGRGSRPPAGSTQEMPMVEGVRRPPIPISRREMEVRTIRQIVAGLAPKISEAERLMLEDAAAAAEEVAGISPKTEFIASLQNGLFHMVLEAYLELNE